MLLQELRNVRDSLYDVRGKLTLVLLSAAYTAERFSATVHEVAPAIFDHIGNTTVSFCATALTAYGLSRFEYGRNAEADPSVVSRTATVCSVIGGTVVNSLAEAPKFMDIIGTPHIGDPRDIALGLAGVALGACAISFDTVKQQRI
ncbi:MAG TPA: hypothetical protein VLF62_03715 [Candidatus Saccharimonadales bacterium]|nr:hypothetical protein [Candidatus Saccharimonadales bacterium]